MTTLMFYKKLVPINRELHKDLRLKPLPTGFSYAAKTHALPLALNEFVHACIEYPIVFAMDDERQGGPIVLTGLREDENLFVDAKGVWDSDYVPAFVRRYPFVLHDQGDDNYIVLIDEECEGFNDPEGERIFKEDGTESEMFGRAVQFLDHFKDQGRLSAAFVTRLADLGLLMPQGIEVTGQDGEKFQLQGFHVVDEQKLIALDDEKLLGLMRSGELGLIYGHLASLGNTQKLIRRLEARVAAAKAA